MNHDYRIEPSGEPGPAVSPRERLQRTITELQRLILERAVTVRSESSFGAGADDQVATTVDPPEREIG